LITSAWRGMEMGITKDAYLRELDQQSNAEELAVEWGFLKRCFFHCDFTYQVDWDLERMYRTAARKFKQGEISGPFIDQRELTDSLKAVVEDAPTKCLRCEKMRDED
jgi:hypothetical protein